MEAPSAAGQPAAPASQQAAVTLIVESLEERLAAVTAAGGLTALPADFGDPQGDWTTVRAADPFTILYLDYRQAHRISPEMAARHRELLQRFWQEKLRSMSQGAARFAILKKYGGPEESERLVRSYPDLIANAYEQLITRGAIDEAHRRIVAEKASAVYSRIDEKLDDFLIDMVLQPEEVRSLLLFGEREGVDAAAIADRIDARLRLKGFVAEHEPSGATLEARLLSTAWIHPSKRRSQPAAAVAVQQQPKPQLLLPLLLFSLVVVLVLVVAAALRSKRSLETTAALATSSTSGEVVETATVSSSATPVMEDRGSPPPLPVTESREVPATATAPPKAEEPPAIDRSIEDRQRLRQELATIAEDSDPRSALERLTTLEQTIASTYVEERIAAAKLRSDLERTLLMRQVEEDRKAADAAVAVEREREWERRLAAIEALMKQPNYSGAKTLADQLLASPDIPPSVADRGRQLRDQAVVELQKIFSSATVKSRTGRTPRRQP